ncbi:MAG: type I-C CRISPR-associated protein Cas7/Csd2 [Tepidisphaeraceae bacterium]
MSTPIQNRYDFVYIFDVTDGNPNGDPDAGNLPRIDAETGQGLVTDVCLKRKVRNFVALSAPAIEKDGPQYNIYVKEKAVLNNQHALAYAAENIEVDEKKRKSKGEERAEEDRRLTRWMCMNFFDVRTFGAVMTTQVNAGQVRGPVQLTIARSVDRIVSQEFAVTRCAVTTVKEAESQGGDNRTMGRKFAVPYGLYIGYGYINAALAQQTGFSEADLKLFKNALNMMFEGDRSAARGRMSPVKCIAFRHENKLGNARADQLFARVKVALKDEIAGDKRPPRSKADYVISVVESDMPAGVTVEHWV